MPDIDGLKTIRMISEKLKPTSEKPLNILLHASSDDAELHRACEGLGVQMPELDGLNATREIRILEQDSGRPVPIMALTAGALKEEQG